MKIHLFRNFRTILKAWVRTAAVDQGVGMRDFPPYQRWEKKEEFKHDSNVWAWGPGSKGTHTKSGKNLSRQVTAVTWDVLSVHQEAMGAQSGAWAQSLPHPHEISWKIKVNNVPIPHGLLGRSKWIETHEESIVKTWKEPKCSSTADWTKTPCVYAVEYYSAMKRMKHWHGYTYG